VPRRRAQEVDTAETDGGWLGLLHGMTVAVKDSIDTASIPSLGKHAERSPQNLCLADYITFTALLPVRFLAPQALGI